MKARRLGTDSPFVEIDKVQLKDNYILYSAEVMEFEVGQNFDYLSTELKTNQQLAEADYWEKLRHQAAIAVLPQCVSTCNDVLMRGGSIQENTIAKQVSNMALQYADELIKQLKER